MLKYTSVLFLLAMQVLSPSQVRSEIQKPILNHQGDADREALQARLRQGSLEGGVAYPVKMPSTIPARAKVFGGVKGQVRSLDSQDAEVDKDKDKDEKDKDGKPKESKEVVTEESLPPPKGPEDHKDHEEHEQHENLPHGHSDDKHESTNGVESKSSRTRNELIGYILPAAIVALF